MVFTTIAIRPETKRLLSEFREENTLGFNSYDDLIKSFLQTSRNAEKLEKRSQRASHIFNLLIGEFPEYWGVIQNIVINNTSKDTLEWLLGTKRVGKNLPESKRIAGKDYRKIKERYKHGKTRRSPKGKQKTRGTGSKS